MDIRQIQLAFHGTGRIQNIVVEEGDHVKSGELVAEMEPVRYEESVARVNLNAARQALTLAVNGPREKDITAARAQVKASEAALKDAKRDP